MASSSCSWGRRAMANPRVFECWPAWRRLVAGGPHRQPGGHAPVAEGPQHRDGIPELRAMPTRDGRPEHGFFVKDRPNGPRRDHAPGPEATELLDLEALLDRKSKSVSGGQRQRVAMGRAIVRAPQVFLMDELLSNRGAKLRVAPRNQVVALQCRLEATTVCATRDRVEATAMGDRVAVLNEGRLQQCASPRELCEKPSNVFAAGCIGPPVCVSSTPPGRGRGSTGGTTAAPQSSLRRGLPRGNKSSRSGLPSRTAGAGRRRPAGILRHGHTRRRTRSGFLCVRHARR